MALSESSLMLKNAAVISISFMILFTSYQSMAALQSSINKDSGLGSLSLSVIYVALVVSSMFVPSFMIDKLKPKWTMVLSMLCYSFFIAAQFYPTFYTLIPAAVVIGFGAAPLWIAKCTYLTKIATSYGLVKGVSTETMIVRFFGVFFLVFQASSIWGGLISAAVLSSGKDDMNSTLLTPEQLSLCGVHYCSASSAPSNGTESAEEEENQNFNTDRTRIYILATIFLICSLVAPTIMALFVDPLSRFKSDTEPAPSKLSGVQLLVATLTHMKEPKQLLIIPLTIWSGLEQGFFGADFMAGYVTCAFGVQNVGLVLLTYAICDAIFSLAFGAVIQFVGRIPIFVLGAIINLSVMVVLFTWPPNPDQGWVFFVLAGLWGVADAIWQTQINALYGAIFIGKAEGGFSNYRFWESLGFLIAYVLQTQICIAPKLWILVGFLTSGMVGYLWVERLERVV